MTLQREDRRFKRRYVLRNTVLLVPPVCAASFVWLNRVDGGLATWLAAGGFVVWIAFWIILDRRMFQSYCCPSCGQSIKEPTVVARKGGDPIRFYCSSCDIEWDTGLRESSE